MVRTGPMASPEFLLNRRMLMAGLGAAAPKPAISMRRFNGNSGLVIRPIWTIFCISFPAVTPCPGTVKKGHFFAAEMVAHVISPPARGIAAGYGCFHAGVAELVDALDLGSSDESCGGSSPSARTKRSIQAFA